MSWNEGGGGSGLFPFHHSCPWYQNLLALKTVFYFPADAEVSWEKFFTRIALVIVIVVLVFKMKIFKQQTISQQGWGKMCKNVREDSLLYFTESYDNNYIVLKQGDPSPQMRTNE